jgi:hypothetical protein
LPGKGGRTRYAPTEYEFSPPSGRIALPGLPGKGGRTRYAPTEVDQKQKLSLGLR